MRSRGSKIFVLFLIDFEIDGTAANCEIGNKVGCQRLVSGKFIVGAVDIDNQSQSSNQCCYFKFDSADYYLMINLARTAYHLI